MTGYESKRVGCCLLLHTLPNLHIPGGYFTAGVPFLLNIDHIITVAPSECGKAVIVTANASYRVEETFDEVMALVDPHLPPTTDIDTSNNKDLEEL